MTSEITENTASDLDNDDVEAEDELSVLKSRAQMMGIKFHPSIGLDALRAKVNATINSEDPEEAEEAEEEEAPVAVAPRPKLTKAQERQLQRAKIRKRNLRLVRCRIANMNPDKAQLQGEFHTISNEVLGIVKHFVPYGEATDEGWHIPYVIYKNLKNRKFQQIKSTRDRKTGRIKVESRLVPEFNIELLPDLTASELNKLKIAQLAASGQLEA